MQKILVVGGFGYLGSIITDMLSRRKHEVDVYDICIWGNEPERSIKFCNHFRSLPDKEYDCVIWLAGIDIDDWYINDSITDNYLNMTILDITKLKSKKIMYIPPNCNNSFTDKLKEVFYEKGAVRVEFSELYGPSSRMRWDTIPNKILFDFLTQNGVILSSMFEQVNILSVYDAAEYIINHIENELPFVFLPVASKQYSMIELAFLIKKIIGNDSLLIGINGISDKDMNIKCGYHYLNSEQIKEPLEKAIKSMLNQLEKNQFQDFTDDRYNNATCVFNMKMAMKLVERLKI